MKTRLLLSFITIVLPTVLFAYSSFQSDTTRSVFKISANKGQKFLIKPTLENRLCGVKEILLLVPNDYNEYDQYVFQNFITYIENLNIKVEVSKANYKRGQTQISSRVLAYETEFDDFYERYVNKSNTLIVSINYYHAQSQYINEMSGYITFYDYMNDYNWVVKIPSIPKSPNKYIKILKENILREYKYNQQYSYIPPTLSTSWNKEILKDYLDENYSDPLEGIYSDDNYELGVKRDDDGKYYIIYLSSKDDLNDWQEGDVKCVLTTTATANIFKGGWFGKWKQDMNATIIFSTAGFEVSSSNQSNSVFIKMYPDAQTIARSDISSGTGFLVNKDYIITNYHVIENAKNGNIKITGLNGDYKTRQKVSVEVVDKQNDIAILKTSSDTSLDIPYTFKFNTSNVGEDCYVLGYPLISSMGMDIKLTNGIISSRTGYDGNIAQYQISAPVQPGNSGGPLFDKDGYVIGIVQAKHTQAENAGYAIKCSYIKNLIDLLPVSIEFPQTNRLKGKSLPQQVALASKAVCIIIVNEKQSPKDNSLTE